MNHLLKHVDIFHELTPDQLEKITQISTEQIFHTGEIILVEGTYSDDLYVILEGEVDILINPSLVGAPEVGELAPVTIATLRRGQSFGEIALVDRGMRSASVRAAQQGTRLMVIPSDKLLAICEEDTLFGFRLMRNLAADLAMKIRNADLRLRDNLLSHHGIL
jgi:CRP-like cAMP-binding protein